MAVHVSAHCFKTPGNLALLFCLSVLLYSVKYLLITVYIGSILLKPYYNIAEYGILASHNFDVNCKLLFQ